MNNEFDLKPVGYILLDTVLPNNIEGYDNKKIQKIINKGFKYITGSSITEEAFKLVRHEALTLKSYIKPFTLMVSLITVEDIDNKVKNFLSVLNKTTCGLESIRTSITVVGVSGDNKLTSTSTIEIYGPIKVDSIWSVNGISQIELSFMGEEIATPHMIEISELIIQNKINGR